VTRARTIFLGSGSFGVPALQRLSEHPDVALVGIVTAPARPAGRKGELNPTPIAQSAPAGTPILTPARLRSTDALEAIAALEPEIAVLADYGQLVPPPILDLPHGALNLHPSLLPRHRGATPIPAAILADDAETGVTLFRMDAGLDTGPIVAVRRTSLDDTDTASSLHARLSVIAAELLTGSLGPWLAGELREQPQPDAGATLTRPLRRVDGRLDPNHPAAELERRVRAFAGWPGTYLDLDQGRLAVHRATVLASEPDAAPGRIVAHGTGLAVTTTSGLLVLDEVQPAGGRRMSGDAFRRGRPAMVGARVS
jgi:methionyl-tRNA formyltransferase